MGTLPPWGLASLPHTESQSGIGGWTVPDLAGLAAANDLVGRSDSEVREAVGDKFPKGIYRQITTLYVARSLLGW